MTVRLAYIISAYQYPDQLVRLVLRLNWEASSFFIHVDRKTDDAVYRRMADGLSGLTNVRFLKRYRCDWGGFGHVRATLEGVKELLGTATPFDVAILLTGQDYPIKPQQQIAAFFETHRDHNFLEHFPLPTEIWRNRGQVGGMDRIEFWHWRMGKRHLRFPPIDGLRLRRKFPDGFRPYGGSSYWCLSRECMEYVHALATHQPAFVNFFKHVDVPDELFFQTLIMNSPFRDLVVNDNLRYIDWKDPTAGSPSILGRDDFAKLTASSKLFARKFDENVDATVLDLIDQHILSQE